MIERLKARQEALYLFVAIVILAAVMGNLLWEFRTQWLAGDEALFIRITDRLPSYEFKSEWWTKDGITDPNEAEYLPETEFYDKVQNGPVWRHPPVASALAWPFVKLFWNEGNPDVSEIDRSIERLRIVAWCLLALGIGGIVYVLRKKGASNKALLAAVVPLVIAWPLFVQQGSNWFYHDMFLVVCLVGALVMREQGHKKLMILLLALMVGTKIYAAIFLIPFAIENRKTLLAGLALVPYQIQIWLTTGDFFWLPRHWALVSEFTPPNYMDTIDHLLYVVADAGSAVPFLVISGVVFGYLIYKAMKREGKWFYPVLLGVSSFHFVQWVFKYYPVLPLYYYQALAMIVVCMFAAGYAVIIYERTKGGFHEKLA